MVDLCTLAALIYKHLRIGGTLDPQGLKEAWGVGDADAESMSAAFERLKLTQDHSELAILRRMKNTPFTMDFSSFLSAIHRAPKLGQLNQSVTIQIHCGVGDNLAGEEPNDR